MERYRILALTACSALALLGVCWFFPITRSAQRLGIPLLPEPMAVETPSARLIDPAEAAPLSLRTTVSPTPSTDSAIARVAGDLNSHSGGWVHGRVLDQNGVGVSRVGVRLYRRGTNVDQMTDAEGRYSFDELDAGGYRLLVNTRSMPDGLLPPWRQEELREYSGLATGLFGTAFELRQNKSREVDLRVFAASSVTGRLVGPNGKPISAAPVLIRSEQGITESTRTDATGSFVLTDVYPGRYVARAFVESISAADSSISASSSPLPIHFELAAGESLELGDFIAGSGGHVLRGSVIDQYANPVTGLAVRCFVVAGEPPSATWNTVTDSAGRYELGRVPSAVLTLIAGNDENGNPSRTPRLARQVAPIRIDARHAKRVIEIAVVEVEATHAFHLVGEIRVDPSWDRANELERALVRVELDGVDATHSLVSDLLGAGRLGPDWSYEFAWDCATPRAELELRVVLLDNAGREHEQRSFVQPVADAMEEVLIAFPQAR